MIQKRPSNERGQADHGWLRSQHTFSFADYRDPAHMGFRALRVINEDRVAPGRGFGAHPHRDMEIFSYVIDGVLEHKDNLGHGSVIRPGEVQVMTAGSGVVHSEFNPSATDPVHFLQVWIHPRETGLKPCWEQKAFAKEQRNSLTQIIGPLTDEDSTAATFAQDARVYVAKLDAGHKLVHALAEGRGAWVQVIAGTLQVGDTMLAAGDGAAIEYEPQIRLTAETDVHFMLIDLA